MAARKRRHSKRDPVREGEEAFLREYRKVEYPKPSVTADAVIFTIRDLDLQVLLIRREQHPFQGCWALPGGFVEVGDGYENQGEDLEEAAYRELEEETGLPRDRCRLEQFGAFGTPYRDPRMRIITVAYLALIRSDDASRAAAGSDAQEVGWFPVTELPDLAFDHGDILDAAVARLRRNLDDAPGYLDALSPRFTADEFRSVYRVIKGTGDDPIDFERRFRRLLEDGLVEQAPAEQQRRPEPAQLYRFTRSGDPGGQ
jgi:8-oxo-dGTP diphosphatase